MSAGLPVAKNNTGSSNATENRSTEAWYFNEFHPSQTASIPTDSHRLDARRDCKPETPKCSAVGIPASPGAGGFNPHQSRYPESRNHRLSVADDSRTPTLVGAVWPIHPFLDPIQTISRVHRPYRLNISLNNPLSVEMVGSRNANGRRSLPRSAQP